MKKYWNIFLFVMSGFPLFSSHIVGGEISYNYLGNNKYEVILKVYRDYPFAGFDAPALLSVYDADSLLDVFEMGFPETRMVPDAFSNPCTISEGNVLIEEGVYTTTLTLTPRAGGYTLIYQRCCRNTGVLNLLDPSGEGASYYTRIPGPEEALGNSSPRFMSFPPLYVCQDINFQFDHSALDPDGDNLLYSLCPPYKGLDYCCPAIMIGVSEVCNLVCPAAAPPPPYLPVVFSAGYSGTYPIASNPAFSINPVTGLFVGTPTLQGKYVVGVCVDEIRNNVVINSHFRDFQFSVIPCTVNVMGAVADQENQCQGLTVNFKNQSLNDSEFPTFFWDFGVPGITSDTSTLNHPSYTYPDTGVYVVRLINNRGTPCSDTLKRNVYVYSKLDLSFEKTRPQCFSNNSLDFKLRGAYTKQALFNWRFSPAATPSVSTSQTPFDIHYTTSGLHTVSVSVFQAKCFERFTDTIRILPKPFAKINNLQQGLCDPADVGFSNGSISELPVKYSWTFSNGDSSTEFEPSQVFTPPGMYEAVLLVETTSPCYDTAMHRISNILVNPSPSAGFSLTPQETTIFDPEIKMANTGSRDVIKSHYDFGDGQDSEGPQTMHVYSAVGNYRVKQTLTNSFGCTDTMSQLLKILPEFRFWIPNSFTPDGNELNDIFKPSTYGVSVYEFEIFNSWGARIFKTDKTEEGWDGSYKGVECQQGTYVWKISFRNAVNGEREMHTGHVMLFRNP